jgi:hypothetical protein
MRRETEGIEEKKAMAEYRRRPSRLEHRPTLHPDRNLIET